MATFDGNIVVNISLDPAPVTEQNFNVVLVAGSTMGAGFTERLRRYSNAAEAAADTDLSAALIAEVAQAFSQRLTPKEVAIGRVDGTTAADDYLVDGLASGAIGDTITTTVYGQSYVWTSATGVETAGDITDAIKIGLDALSIPGLTVTDNGNDFNCTTANAGQRLNVSVAVTGAATATATQAGTGVTLYDELGTVAAEDNDWYYVVLESRDAWDIWEAARYTEANRNFGVFQSNDAGIIAATTTDIAETLKDLSYSKCSIWYFSSDTTYLDTGLAANRSVVDPDLDSSTFANVIVSGATADDDNLTSTQKSNALGKNANLFLTNRGTAVTGNGKTPSGEWIDVVISADWLEARLGEDASNAIIAYTNRGEKIPYTDQGINALAALIEARLDQGVAAGHFVEDTASVNPPLLADVTAATRAARELTIPFSVEPAGAIQFPTFNGYISLTT